MKDITDEIKDRGIKDFAGAVVTFNADTFTAETDDEAWDVFKDVQEADKVIEYTREDAEFEDITELLGFIKTRPQRVYIAYGDYGKKYFTLRFDFD